MLAGRGCELELLCSGDNEIIPASIESIVFRLPYYKIRIQTYARLHGEILVSSLALFFFLSVFSFFFRAGVLNCVLLQVVVVVEKS